MASNAEHAGASLLVIISDGNDIENDISRISDDNSKLSVNIPTLIVSKSTGDKLIEVINASEETIVKFMMIAPQSNLVDVHFFIRLTDSRFYQFVQSLEPYLTHFGDKLSVGFTFYQDTDDTLTAETIANLGAMINCLTRETVYGILGRFGSSCVAKETITIGCLEQEIEQFNKKQLASTRSCFGNKTTEYMEKLVQAISLSKRHSNSHILINDYEYDGSYQVDILFDAICSLFVKSPSNCLYLDNRYVNNAKYNKLQSDKKRNKTFLLTSSIVTLIVLLILAGYLLLRIFGKIYQRILHERIELIVKDTVDNYNVIRDNQ